MILFTTYAVAEDAKIKLRNPSAPLRTSFAERDVKAFLRLMRCKLRIAIQDFLFYKTLRRTENNNKNILFIHNSHESKDR